MIEPETERRDLIGWRPRSRYTHNTIWCSLYLWKGWEVWLLALYSIRDDTVNTHWHWLVYNRARYGMRGRCHWLTGQVNTSFFDVKLTWHSPEWMTTVAARCIPICMEFQIQEFRNSCQISQHNKNPRNDKGTGAKTSWKTRGTKAGANFVGAAV